MNLARRIPGYFAWLSAGVGIVGAGAMVLVWMSGAPTACADSSDAVPVIPVTPESLLSTSTDNLAAANTLLGRADLPSEFQVVLGPQTEALSNGVNVISEFEGIQAPLLSSNDSSLANLGDLLFFNDDQQIEQASADVLSATQIFDANPAVATEFDLLLADAQLGGAVLDTLLSNAVASLADQLPGLGGDAAGSAIGAANLFPLL